MRLFQSAFNARIENRLTHRRAVSLVAALATTMTTALTLPLALLVSLVILSFVSCSSNGSEIPVFDAQAVLRHIQDQCDLGPRVPGSEASLRGREFFREYFEDLGYEVTLEEFVHYDHQSNRPVPMANIVIQPAGGIDPTARRILLGAHWDSRPRCEQDPDPARRNDSLPGANDGAAGSAVLMELARMFSVSAPTVPVEIVLFDGEDWGREGDLRNYCLGSQEFARHTSADKYEFAVIVDIIAHPGARFVREGFSERYAKEINDRLWTAAAALGVTRFVDSVGTEVYDDHLMLLNDRIPSVDIIDMNYEFWHTSQDTPDKCDSAAIADVGRTVAKVVYEFRQ